MELLMDINRLGVTVLVFSIVLPILIVQDVVSVWAFRRNWDGRTLAFMIPGAAVGILLGYLFAALISIAMVEMAVGVTSIGFAAWQLWIRRHALPPAPGPITWVASIFGLASGFTSQISHAGGPPFQMYLLPKQLPRDVFIGTSAIYFVTARLLPRVLGLDAIDDVLVANEAFEELVPFGG
jgi:uncharacterized membrane protein YfcA